MSRRELLLDRILFAMLLIVCFSIIGWATFFAHWETTRGSSVYGLVPRTSK